MLFLSDVKRWFHHNGKGKEDKDNNANDKIYIQEGRGDCRRQQLPRKLNGKVHAKTAKLPQAQVYNKLAGKCTTEGSQKVLEQG